MSRPTQSPPRQPKSPTCVKCHKRPRHRSYAYCTVCQQIQHSELHRLLRNKRKLADFYRPEAAGK